MEPSESERVNSIRQRVGGLSIHVKEPPGITEDMYRPLLFPNHQFHFKLFNVVVCLGIGYYFVFKHDFGPERHVFTPIREFKARMMQEFFKVDPNDLEVQAIREDMERKKRELKQTPSTYDGRAKS